LDLPFGGAGVSGGTVAAAHSGPTRPFDKKIARSGTEVQPAVRCKAQQNALPLMERPAHRANLGNSAFPLLAQSGHHNWAEEYPLWGKADIAI
jgi:hypothetical protein